MKNTMIGHTIQKDTGLRGKLQCIRNWLCCIWQGERNHAKRRQRYAQLFHPEHEICIWLICTDQGTKVADGCDLDVFCEEIGAKKGQNPVKKRVGVWSVDPTTQMLTCCTAQVHSILSHIVAWAGVQCVSMRQPSHEHGLFPLTQLVVLACLTHTPPPHPPHCWVLCPYCPQLLHPLDSWVAMHARPYWPWPQVCTCWGQPAGLTWPLGPCLWGLPKWWGTGLTWDHWTVASVAHLSTLARSQVKERPSAHRQGPVAKSNQLADLNKCKLVAKAK